MSNSSLSIFLDAALSRPDDIWNQANLAALAAWRVPEIIFGARSDLLRADIHRQWALWFVESICDPSPFIFTSKGYAHFYSAVLPRIKLLLPMSPSDEQSRISGDIATILKNMVERQRRISRSVPDWEIKRFLIDMSFGSPRCWLCGFEFSKTAVDRFLGFASAKPALPKFVDFLKPIGLKGRDVQIEIDHLFPVAHGGRDEDNLKLTCGWCNSNKGASSMVYDCRFNLNSFTHPHLGPTTLPNPFWVIRTIATRRKCEWEGGCDKSAENSEMTVCARHPDGAMNLANMKVVCADHHPLGSQRLIPARLLLPAKH